LAAGFYNKPIAWKLQGEGTPSVADQNRIRAAAGLEANRHEIGEIEFWSIRVNLSSGQSVRFSHLGGMGLAKFGPPTIPESVAPSDILASWGTQDPGDAEYVRSFGTDHGPGDGGSTSPLHFEVYTPDLVDVVGCPADLSDNRYLDFCIANLSDEDTVTWSWSIVESIGGVPTRWLDTDADLSGCSYAMLELDWMLSVASISSATPAATFEITATISGSVNASVFTSMHIGGGVSL